MKMKQTDNQLTVSVAMSVYNGERFIRDQLNSILFQLGEADELILSYSPSKDGSFRIINQYEKNDNRIHIIFNENPSDYVYNTNRLLEQCSGDIIFMAGQDSIWSDNKIQSVLDEFNRNPKITTVVHDASGVRDWELNPSRKTYFQVNHTNKYLTLNLLKNSFDENCMAFSSAIRDLVCPIPKKIGSLGMWIGIISGAFGKISLIKKSLMLKCSGETVKVPQNYNRFYILKSLKKRQKAVEVRQSVGKMKRRKKNNVVYSPDFEERSKEIS